MKYSFRIVHGAATKSEANVDSVLKNKIWVWKPACSKKLITIQCLLCLVELKDGEIKLGGLRLDQDGCSCAAICNEHNEMEL